MSRPNRVYPNSLPKYDKLTTRKVKMFSGTEITALHLVKETDQYFVSIDSWAACCSKFKTLKYGTELKVEIPVISDKKTLEFLNKHAWHYWVDRELKDKANGNSDMVETIALLDKLFPDKRKTFFYELNSIVYAFCHGSFISYDENGNIETAGEHQIDQRKYYSHKYHKFEPTTKEIKALYDAYHNTTNKVQKDIAFKIYHNAEKDYVYQHHNLTDTFIEIGKNAVVCPYVFSKRCVAGSEYENAGEVYFVVTPDTVYFETQRHF